MNNQELLDALIKDTDYDEVAKLKLQNQAKLLDEASSFKLTADDVVLILAQNTTITLPSGEVKKVSDIFNKEIDLPFKVGYKWQLQGTTFVLVKDEKAIGTADNPIIWTADVKMLDNAFYIKDNTTYVCMNGELIEM